MTPKSSLRGFLSLVLVTLTSATHYRFGTISHKPGASPGQVVFTIQLAYRRSFRSSWRVGNIGDLVSSSGRWKLGDGTQTWDPSLYITGFSVDNDWVFLEGTYTHTYSDVSVTYYAEFNSCCRISSLLNNRDANYISRTMVTFPTRGNESPVSGGLPIVELLQGSVGRFTIPFDDTDNDPMNCSVADPVNTLGRTVSNAYPSWLSVDNAGTVRYDTTLAAAGLWNFAVQISDPHSYIHVDFIVQVKERESFCSCTAAANTRCAASSDCASCGQDNGCNPNVAPRIVSPSPAEGSTVTVSQGQIVQLQFYATDANPLDTITMLMASAPASASISASVASNGTTSATVQWQPPTGAANFYVQIFCLWAQDNHLLQSTQHCVSLLVDPVTTVPEPPAAPFLIQATGQTLTVGWAPANVTDTRTVSGFKLYMDGAQLSASPENSLFATTALPRHTASYLIPVSEYSFTLELCNRLGCSTPSSPAVFATIGAPFNPPSVPVLLARTERSITIGWDAPYIPQNRTVSQFQIVRTPMNGAPVTVFAAAGAVQYTFDTLQPASTHSFTVAACEALQCGRESEPGIYDTLDGFSSLCDQSCPPKDAAVRATLLAHWSFDEGNGTVAANSIEGAPDMSLRGQAQWKAGEHGKAVELDALSHLEAPHGTQAGNRSLVIGPDYTVCLWRRLHPGLISGPLGVSLLTKGGSASNASISPLHLVEHFPGQVKLLVSDGTTKLSNAIVTVPYQLEKWRHVCFVRDRGQPLHTAQSCTLTGFAYNSTVLNSTSPVQSAVLCQSQCNSYQGCGAFNWVADGFVCTLLSTAQNSTATPGVVSGPPRCGPVVVGYLDGVKQVTVSDPTNDTVSNEESLILGKAIWDGEQSLVGRLDEVLIYNKALTTPQVAAVFTSCLPTSQEPLECPQCPLNVSEPWPLMENFQTGGADPIGCRECCASKCDQLCFAQGSNPGRCMGSSPLEAYMRCMGTGYAFANCSHTNSSLLSGCSFGGVVRRCPLDCALQGAAAGTYGKCDTWTGKCTFPVECDSGYVQVGALCLDADECQVGEYGAAFCATRNAACVNTVGSFECTCLEGFSGNASIGVCTNVDECSAVPSVCHAQAQCSDADGGFSCLCHPGFLGDGKINGTGCVDVDECRTGTHTCSATADCDNTPGNYTCSCKSGFIGNGYDSTAMPGFGTDCVDRDECADGTQQCGANAECENEVGHYDCNCVAGFSGSGTSANPCVDIDECSLGLHNCTQNSECVNLPGNYSCACNAGFSGDGFAGTCARCTSMGTTKAIALDGFNDRIQLSTAAPLELCSSAGFSSQVWLYHDGSSSFQSSFTYDAAYNYSSAGSLVGTSAAGSLSFDPILVSSYNASVNSSGLGFFVGLEGSNLVTGVTLNTTGAIARFVIRSLQLVPLRRWVRASTSYTTSTARLTLWMDTIELAAASLAGASSTLVESNSLLTLGGDSIGAGVLKGRLREARVWSSSLTQRDVVDSDCQPGTPLLRFVWAGAAAAGSGCDPGDYCQEWLSPATCLAAPHIICGVAAVSVSTTSSGSLGNATWTLMQGAAETNDWPITMHDGTSYWHKLVYGSSIGPCTDSPACSMSQTKTLPRPCPVFQYMSGLTQTHIGTSCTGTPVARVLLNSQACLREFTYPNSTTAWVAAYGSSYAALDKWDCQSAFIGTGLQEYQTLSQAASVSCPTPVAGPGLTLGSGDGFVYVQ